jgi:hypothetical protein
MSSLPFFDDPFTYQLLNVHLVDEEYIVLEVFHRRGEFVSTKFRNEIHIKSKSITPHWLSAFNELMDWPPISIEQTSPDSIIISQGEYIESMEMLGIQVYFYEERHIPLS